jgi:hypothetical protein
MIIVARLHGGIALQRPMTLDLLDDSVDSRCSGTQSAPGLRMMNLLCYQSDKLESILWRTK